MIHLLQGFLMGVGFWVAILLFATLARGGGDPSKSNRPEGRMW
jgi:hypothetical protein